jgi:nitrogen fixation protein FixH
MDNQQETPATRSARVSDPAETGDRRSPDLQETFGQPGGSVGRPATADTPGGLVGRPATAPWAERRHRRFWVGLVVSLLAGQVVLLSTMAYVAISDGSFAVEPDYYQKGLHWDDTAAQLRRNVALGWSVRVEIGDSAATGGERTLICHLTNRNDEPLDGATIDVAAFPHARGSERSTAMLAAAGDGSYETPLRFSRYGVWEFRFVVQRGPETFTQTVVRRVEPPEAS